MKSAGVNRYPLGVPQWSGAGNQPTRTSTFLQLPPRVFTIIGREHGQSVELLSNLFNFGFMLHPLLLLYILSISTSSRLILQI